MQVGVVVIRFLVLALFYEGGFVDVSWTRADQGFPPHGFVHVDDVEAIVMGFRLDFIKSHLLLLGLGLFLFGIVGVASSFHDVPTRSTCSHNKIFLQLTVHIPVDLIQIQRLNTQCQWHGHLLLAASTATAHGHLASLAILPAALSRDIKPIAVPQISAGLPLQGELELNEQLGLIHCCTVICLYWSSSPDFPRPLHEPFL